VDVPEVRTQRFEVLHITGPQALALGPMMKEMRTAGSTLKTTAGKLDEEGYTKRRGNPCSPSKLSWSCHETLRFVCNEQFEIEFQAGIEVKKATSDPRIVYRGFGCSGT
jgi:hypothetical protein